MFRPLNLFYLSITLCILLLASCTTLIAPAASQPENDLAPALATPEATRTYVSDIELIGVITVPNNTMAFETLVGGLSAIAYAGEGNTYYFLSDDRAINGPSRIYEATVDVSDGSLDDGDLLWTGLVPLQDESGTLFARGAIDPEGLVYTGEDFYVSSEGSVAALPPIPPAIFHFGIEGEFIASLPLPEKFLGVEGGNRGVRDNKGFESLTRIPQSSYLVSAVENALVQDGPAATLEEGSPVRVLTLDPVAQQVIGEAVYMVERIPRAPNPSSGDADNGLVDLIALDDAGSLLALERSYAQGAGNTVRLYLASTQGATDVSRIEALAEESAITPIAKEQLADFSELGSTLGIAPDNLEGMALGPQLEDRRYLLLVVSDNNFSPSQTTQLWALAISLNN